MHPIAQSVTRSRLDLLGQGFCELGIFARPNNNECLPHQQTRCGRGVPVGTQCGYRVRFICALNANSQKTNSSQILDTQGRRFNLLRLGNFNLSLLKSPM